MSFCLFIVSKNVYVLCNGLKSIWKFLKIWLKSFASLAPDPDPLPGCLELNVWPEADRSLESEFLRRRRPLWEARSIDRISRQKTLKWE